LFNFVNLQQFGSSIPLNPNPQFRLLFSGLILYG